MFMDREIPIIPHKNCHYGTGSGFFPVNPAHNIDDNEHAEIFNLPTKGFVNKAGLYKDEYLGEDFKGKTIDDEDFLMKKLKKNIVFKYDDTHTFYKVKSTQEVAIMISLDAWFIKLDE